MNELVHVFSFGPIKPAKVFGLIEANGWWHFYDLGGGLGTGIRVDTDWHHHCICYDGKQITYYFDGDAVAAVEREIAEFVIYNRALTADQVKLLMNGAHGGPSP